MAKPVLRCAVYTRKSTEDGLEQEFNSLDAQYEACAAYVMSQRHEGWTLVTDRYDDGGFSGGNMERPGLTRLLADVAAGKVNVIVLYKIDRLTRSLTDFARIVEILDKAGSSFVSITQAFNTTTSMGRLMLNVLLSFAQFEREVTGERIRDKIAASKRKGLWMGGPVPLGYDVQDRKLVVNDAEATLVRHVMRRYCELGSVRELIEELDRDGYRTKVQHRTSGPHRGGCRFRRGTLYHLLSNRIYLGEIIHKDESFPGEHEPIVPQTLWNEVQEKLAVRSQGGATRLRAKQPSLLAGLVTDGLGRPMTPSHANRHGRRYRYYVTRPDQPDAGPAWRCSAHDLEVLVTGKLVELFSDRLRLHEVATDCDGQTLQRALDAAALAAAALQHGSSGERLALTRKLVQKVRLEEGQLIVAVDTEAFLVTLGLPQPTDRQEPMEISCDAVRIRQGHELKLVIPGPAPAHPARRDEKLIALLAEAHATRQLVLASGAKSIASIASEAGRCRTRLGKLFSLSLLAPDIVTAIIEGRQPPSLNAKTLVAANLPLAWAEQRSALGFA